jgi:hypothetical protein
MKHSLSPIEIDRQLKSGDLVPDEFNCVAYSPLSGDMVWLISSGKVKTGTVGGYINNVGYVVIRYQGKAIGAHRLAWKIMTKSWPEHQIDHANGNPRDNRWENLRAATPSQNGYNKAKNSNNTSGYKGAYFHKPSGRWHSGIRINGKAKYLGHFATAEEAHAAYVKAATEMHREFFRV